VALVCAWGGESGVCRSLIRGGSKCVAMLQSQMRMLRYAVPAIRPNTHPNPLVSVSLAKHLESFLAVMHLPAIADERFLVHKTRILPFPQYADVPQSELDEAFEY